MAARPENTRARYERLHSLVSYSQLFFVFCFPFNFQLWIPTPSSLCYPHIFTTMTLAFWCLEMWVGKKVEKVIFSNFTRWKDSTNARESFANFLIIPNSTTHESSLRPSSVSVWEEKGKEKSHILVLYYRIILHSLFTYCLRRLFLVVSTYSRAEHEKSSNFHSSYEFDEAQRYCTCFWIIQSEKKTNSIKRAI